MNVAIVTSGILPVPPVKGGAVENLVKFYLDYNEIQSADIQFTVYSVSDKLVSDADLFKYKKTKFVFINTSTFISRIKRLLFRFTNKNLYYHHSWEFFISEVSHKIKKKKFDVVVVENRPGFVLRLSKCTDAKLILHLHNDILNKETKYASEILKLYSKIIVVSNYIKNQVDTIMHTNKIFVLHNGIELNKFEGHSNLQINRQIFNLENDDFVVVFSGRIEPEKGVKELLTAFSLLPEYKKIKLLILGGGNGNINTGTFFSEMNTLASTMPDKVVFSGFQPYNSIPDILGFCDVAIVPSIWEDPFPTTVLESLAAGLPIVVTRSGGIVEAVNDKCSIVLERNATLIDNIANAIINLYENKELLSNMSRFAKDQSKKYSKEIYALSFIENIKSIFYI